MHPPGIGIPPEDLQHIFHEFVQLCNAGGEGTGLGLPISKRLAHLLGDELDARSTPGGSVFGFRRPAPPIAVSVPAGVRATPE